MDKQDVNKNNEDSEMAVVPLDTISCSEKLPCENKRKLSELKRQLLCICLAVVCIIFSAIILAQTINLSTILMEDLADITRTSKSVIVLSILCGFILIVLISYTIAVFRKRFLAAIPCAVFLLLLSFAKIGVLSTLVYQGDGMSVIATMFAETLATSRGLVVDTLNESFWKHLQQNFKCCGVNGPEDYTGIERTRCCPSLNIYDVNELNSYTKDCLQSDKHFKDGCLAIIIQKIQYNRIHIIWETILVVLLMTVLSVFEFSMVAYSKFKKRQCSKADMQAEAE